MNMQSNAEFLQKLTATFLVEAHEHLEVLGAGLLELEKTTGRDAQLPRVETLFREAHCLKGAARAVNSRDIERHCQMLEGAAADFKSGSGDLPAEALDRMHRAVTAVGRLIDAMDTGRQEPAEAVPAEAVPAAPQAAPRQAEDPGRKQEGELTGGRRPQAQQGRDGGGDSVRIATHKLDAIFVQAEELLGVKLSQAERALELKALAGLVDERERLWNETLPLVRDLRQQVEARNAAPGQGGHASDGSLELSAHLLAFLDRDQVHAEAVGTRITNLRRVMVHDRRRLDAMVDRLLEDVKKTLMLPFETLLAGFPKMARDLACDIGKQVGFSMRGTDIEIDKRILEKIKDPLLHLVRNSIDHGIETPAERVRCGKDPCGRVTLTITQEGGKVGITVTDDGVGFDPATIKAAALRAGVITEGEAAALGDKDVPQLVFRSGVTTRPQATMISGRGLGMAIVEENVAKLNGTVDIESTPGAGTTVNVGLPLTLATLRGILVQAANREFVIPTANVIRVVRVTPASIRRVQNRDSIFLDGTTLALVRLGDVLGLVSGHSSNGRTAPLTALVLRHGNVCIAFVVDQIMGEQEVLAKPLGRLLPRVRNVAGATVFGIGRVVPILSVPDLLQTAVGCAQTRELEPGSEGMAETVRAKRLLVADDSITARTLLQNILESSGYSIKTAPDGAAAFDILQDEAFDLLVSDVEMPRMDGFELTKRIRGNPQLAGLPVVLVTSLEAKTDRERGIDAGANAYIVKLGFDQSNLLDVIGELI